MNEITRALHLLLARLHLQLAGVRQISDEELTLAEDIASWWARR